MREHLVGRFADAGLPLVVTERAIALSVDGAARNQIVQIDIQRGGHRSEWFRLFPGAEDNRIEVVGTDRHLGQLVMMVHEPPRAFTERLPFWNFRDIDLTAAGWMSELAARMNVRPSAIRPVYGVGQRLTEVSVIRRSDDTKRHFLCGLDERQLFIAQLPKPSSTVREAHVALKKPELVRVERDRRKTAPRQGEFFFVTATAVEEAAIETGLTRNRLVLERKAPIGVFMAGPVRQGRRKVRQFQGNPHTADELVVVPGAPPTAREIFVRGKVRHVDHRTVEFRHWVRVILNAEANFGRAAGVQWVD